MINILAIVLALLSATFHLLYQRQQGQVRQPVQVVDLYLVYFLYFCVGFVGIIGFIGHVFFANEVAAMIGWPAGNPFQFEVGFNDGAWGLLGILSIIFRGYFWLATGLGWSFFLLGAAYGHIRDAMIHHNFASYNVGSIAPDLIIPVILLSLLYMKFVIYRDLTRRRT